MDKATGEPFLQNGEQITSEVTFVPEVPSGSVEVLFTFDAKLIKADTNIVVFESLYSDSKELTVHADIEDENQTVTVIVPEAKTEASTDRKKETTIGGEITIEDSQTRGCTESQDMSRSGLKERGSKGKAFIISARMND